MVDHRAADELDDGVDADAPVADAGAMATDSPTDCVRPDGRDRTNRPRRRRVSRWDRPPDPHDWRFYVGNLGKILIATGLLLFGFVAYQLWGTGIETARAQHRLENQFEKLLAEDPGEPVVDVPATDTDQGTEPDVGNGVDDESDVTVPEVEPDAVEPDVEPDVSDPIPVAVDLSDQAIAQDPIPKPFRGDPLLRLEIPKIGRDDIVVPGVSLDDLKDGPGHYPETPLPGQLGNAAIAGHRTTYGAPFFNVDDLEAGDEIIATLLNGDRFVYQVTSVEVVSASDYWVVTTRDPDIAELTLTSCHPKYTARDRIVVHSVLDPERSSDVGLPTFYSLDENPDDAPIEGDDPVLSADATDEEPSPVDPADPAGDVEPSSEESSDAPATDETTSEDTDETTSEDSDDTDGEVPVAAADTPPLADDGGGSAPVDGFSQGWFEDRAAFAQIALWAMVLTVISVLSYLVAKRFRRYSVGFVVGVVPFLVALYFFYQNVNRLLPPGI